MITIILVGLVCFVAGILVGAISHLILMKETAVTAVELSEWAQRLRNAVNMDVQSAKEKIRGLIGEIEKKI
jgi:hypothetical protein